MFPFFARLAAPAPFSPCLVLAGLALAGGMQMLAPVDVLAQGAAGNSSKTGAAPARKADPVFDAAEKAFLALDMEARKSIQNDLIWVAHFPGSPTGDFGPLTFAAIRRFETEARLQGNAILSGPERERLAKMAEERRRAAGFALQTDPVSGMEIGLPALILAKHAANTSGGTRWQDRDERITVDLAVYKPDDALPALFERGIDPKVKGRKITYKLLRPDYFVITGETAGGKFYRRLEKNEKGEIRGFSIGYDKTVAGSVDPFIVAIAGSFEPFPQSATRSKGQQGTGPVAQNQPSRRRATGLVLAPDVIVTAEAALKACAEIVIEGGSGAPIRVQFGRKLETTGLVLVAARAGKPLAMRVAAATDGAGTLVQRDSEGQLLASAATISRGKAETSLQVGGAGAALFDRSGALVGVIAVPPVEKFKVAGIVPSLGYAFVPALDVLRLAGAPPATGGDATPKSAAAIAEAAREGLVSLVCASDK
jgi:peptidoglycan hydrolase-like protein with peptidoglycan-binding domain